MSESQGLLRGLPLYAEQRGPENGDPVLLVHGMVVASRGCLPLAEALAQRGWNVWIPDQAGFGRSPKPSRALNVDALADCLGTWMGQTNLGPWRVVGNSFGTQVAAALVQRWPRSAMSLALVSPTIDRRFRRWGWPRCLPAGRRSAGLRRGAGAKLQDGLVRLWLQGDLPSPDLRTLLWQEYLAAGPARALSTYRHALRDDISSRLPDISQPLLVVRSQGDSAVSPEWATSLADSVGGTYTELPEASHDAQYLAPDRLADVLEPFLRLGALGSAPNRRAGVQPPVAMFGQEGLEPRR